MSRINKINPDEASGKSKELLDTVKSKMGMVPNILRIYANAPAALEAYLNFSGALQQGVLNAKEREQISLVVSEANQCEYCLSAHSAVGKMVGLKENEILEARRGKSTDERTAAILEFALLIVEKRGFVSNEELENARSAGLSDEEIVEIIANVAYNIFTNYFNHVVETDIDFPLAEPLVGTNS